MAQTKSELQAEFKQLADEMQSLAAKGTGLTPEEIARFNEIKPKAADIKNRLMTADAISAAAGDNADFLKQAVTALEQPQVQTPGVVTSTAAGHETYDRATKLLLESVGPGVSPSAAKAFRKPEYKTAYQEYLRTKGAVSMMRGDNYKILQEGLDTEGGFLLPEDFLARLIERKPTPTRVADFCTQMTTGVDRKTIPKVIYNASDNNLYTTGMRVTWVGENPGSATAARVTDPVFGTVQIPIYTAMMSLPITKDLMEDAAFDLEGYIAGKFRETYDLLRDNMVLNGTGVGQPTGILANVNGTSPLGPSYIPTKNATALTSDAFLTQAFSLPEQYDENARFVMNKTNTGAAMSLLKDGNGRYLWGMGIQDSGLAPGGLGNAQRMCAGYPVTWSGFMPNVAANAYPVLFGDFTGYYLINRIGMSIQVLNELYAEQNYVVLLGRLRFGGQLVEEWKLSAMKVATS